MKFAVIQNNTAWKDRDANFEALTPQIKKAVSHGANFVVLPEMFSTGFVVDDSSIGEPVGGPSSQFLSDMAAKHHIHIGGSCPEVSPDDPRPHNTFVIASPNGDQYRYHKIHPFSFGGETAYFRPGQSTQTITIDNIRITMFVCYDLRFAEEFWRTAPETDVYLVPANWPDSRREHWLTLLRARAIENQAYVVGCNRVGIGDSLTYSGDSRIIDPLGTVLAAGDNSVTVIYADINAAYVTEVRHQFPFMQDRVTQ
jgi:predicted amidohydrolase